MRFASFLLIAWAFDREQDHVACPVKPVFPWELYRTLNMYHTKTQKYLLVGSHMRIANKLVRLLDSEHLQMF